MYENQFCIVRCYGAGVFFARVESLDGQTAQLRDARRIWYWDGAASLSQLATEGTKAPESCKFTVTVPQMTVTQVIEIIPCSEQAIASIGGVKEWKRT
ncbi:MAG: hypothetical protein IKO83_01430 [Oscillospiraceae bacterium]|nr:hypothetical protein [Oscillospiraceae bacterium]MBR7190519.1 hypothetical protein [Oscillospiraceae bacterium]